MSSVEVRKESLFLFGNENTIYSGSRKRYPEKPIQSSFELGIHKNIHATDQSYSH